MKITRKLGQNTAEYVMMLVLVAGAAIATFSIFGEAIGNRFANVIQAMNGEAVSTKTNIDDSLNTKVQDWGVTKFNSLDGTGAGSSVQ